MSYRVLCLRDEEILGKQAAGKGGRVNKKQRIAQRECEKKTGMNGRGREKRTRGNDRG